jgi:hypothetical protein
MEFTGVVTVRKGKIRGFDFFWDHAEALEAAGHGGLERPGESDRPIIRRTVDFGPQRGIVVIRRDRPPG